MEHVQKLVEGVLKFEIDPASKTTMLSATQIAKEILILSKMIVIQKVVVSKGRLFYFFIAFVLRLYLHRKFRFGTKSEIISQSIEIQLATKLSAHTSFR